MYRCKQTTCIAATSQMSNDDNNVRDIMYHSSQITKKAEKKSRCKHTTQGSAINSRLLASDKPLRSTQSPLSSSMELQFSQVSSTHEPPASLPQQSSQLASLID